MFVTVLVMVLLGTLLLPDPAEAIPRYSARYQQNCNLCHHNPTGGGMRSAYASQFLIPMEMSAVPWTEEEQVRRLDGQITESISVGADLRTLYLNSEEGNNPEGFFQMQGDLYVLFEVDPKISFYFDRGQSQTRELFALGYVLPANGYVKVGRFTPAYGWRFADHNLWVRSQLGYAPPANTDTGVEVGFYPGSAALHVGIVNGAQGAAFDADDRPALSLRAAWRQRLGPVSVAAGGSYRYNDAEVGLERAAGPFGSVHVGPLTWVGEADWRRDESGAGTDEWVTSHEVTWALRRGVDARITYDFWDPDTDLTTGSRSRMGGGFDTLLYPFFGLQAMVHRWEHEDGTATAGLREYTEALILAHFLF